jgi:transcriptional antiterminator RfaH
LKRWYLAKSKPQMVTWLTSSLSSLGVETFYPAIMSVRRGKKRHEPLFPGFVFCGIDPEKADWPAIHWSPGLDFFLNTDDGPVRIPDDLIEAIRSCAVSLQNGASSGCESTLSFNSPAYENLLDDIFRSSIPSKQRIRVLLDALGCEPHITMPASNRAWTAPTPQFSLNRI